MKLNYNLTIQRQRERRLWPWTIVMSNKYFIILITLYLIIVDKSKSYTREMIKSKINIWPSEKQINYFGSQWWSRGAYFWSYWIEIKLFVLQRWLSCYKHVKMITFYHLNLNLNKENCSNELIRQGPQIKLFLLKFHSIIE